MEDEEELDEFEKKLLAELEEEDENDNDNDEVKEEATEPKDKVTEKQKGDTQMSRLSALADWKKTTEEEEKKEGNGGGKFWKPVVGKNRIRLLPGSYEGDLPFVSYSQHYVGGKFIVVAQQDNPLTRQGWLEHNEHKDSDPEAAKKARAKWLPSKSVAVNIIDRADEDAKPKIWVTSEVRMMEIISLIDDYGDFFDVEDARDIILNRVGTGPGTKYNLVPAPKATFLSDNADEIETILEQAEDLDDWLANQIVKTSELEKIVEANA